MAVNYRSLYSVPGAVGWGTLFNTLLDLLQARRGFDVEEVEIDLSATDTATGIFPAKRFAVGVSWKVTQLVVISGGASFKVGDGTTADRYGTGAALTLNSTGEDVATADPTGWRSTAGDVKLTPNAGTFTSGKVLVRAVFLRTTAP